MDKQNGLYVVYLYNGILFSNRKELSTDTGHNMNDPWNMLNERSQTQKVTCMIYMKHPEE